MLDKVKSASEFKANRAQDLDRIQTNLLAEPVVILTTTDPDQQCS
jgi:hypothetical protein